MQLDLLSAVSIPPAPVLKSHTWPYPGLSADDSARSSLSQSSEFAEVIALTIKQSGKALITDTEALALIPRDWRELLGRWAHASLAQWQADPHGIRVEYVSHDTDAGGFHWQYRIPGKVSQ